MTKSQNLLIEGAKQKAETQGAGVRGKPVNDQILPRFSPAALLKISEERNKGEETRKGETRGTLLIAIKIRLRRDFPRPLKQGGKL